MKELIKNPQRYIIAMCRCCSRPGRNPTERMEDDLTNKLIIGAAATRSHHQHKKSDADDTSQEVKMELSQTTNALVPATHPLLPPQLQFLPYHAPPLQPSGGCSLPSLSVLLVNNSPGKEVKADGHAQQLAGNNKKQTGEIANGTSGPHREERNQEKSMVNDPRASGDSSPVFLPRSSSSLRRWRSCSVEGCARLAKVRGACLRHILGNCLSSQRSSHPEVSEVRRKRRRIELVGATVGVKPQKQESPSAFQDSNHSQGDDTVVQADNKEKPQKIIPGTGIIDENEIRQMPTKTLQTVREVQAPPGATRLKKPKKKLLCKVPTCKNLVKSKGLCKRHGGGTRCGFCGCPSSARQGGFCIRHGGGLCRILGCRSGSRKDGLCSFHHTIVTNHIMPEGTEEQNLTSSWTSSTTAQWRRERCF